MVEGAGEKGAQRAFPGAVFPKSGTAVITFIFYNMIHLFQKLRRVLEIRVHEYAVISGSVLETCIHRRFFPEIPGEGQITAAAVCMGKVLQQFRGAVAASVVHEDEFTVCALDLGYRI